MMVGVLCGEIQINGPLTAGVVNKKNLVKEIWGDGKGE